MADDSSEAYELLNRITDEYMDRMQRGDRPTADEYCTRYPHLAEEIRDLLGAMVEIEQVEEDLRESQAPAPSSAPLAGHHVGDYHILREVGRGGMGVVYEAEQVSLGRRVALKILPIHGAQDSKALERFRREARSAAKLHHTNIVPVFEVGQDGDVLFYAMQFIQGQSLDQVIGELRRVNDELKSTIANSRRGPAGRPPIPATVFDPSQAPHLSQVALSLMTERFQRHDLLLNPSAQHGSTTLPLKQDEEWNPCSPATVPESGASGFVLKPDSPASQGGRADRTDSTHVEPARRHFLRSVAHIGQQTAHALAYAHARGLIHRDIKPSNLLLDALGVVWVTDFGLAKLMNDNQGGGLTQTGDIVGTLRYMAPERFHGSCDTRADIYALGLTLYELLLLRPAFKASDRLKLIDQIQHHDPPPPRRLDRRIPRDLETIILKSIEREPKRRYQSAEEMAEDLRRYLAGEPIQARPVTSGERLVKWARRKPAVAALGITVVLVAALGLAGVLWQWQHALARAEEAQFARREAEHQRDQVRRVNQALGTTMDRLRRTAYLAHMNLAQRYWNDTNLPRVFELLEGERPRSPDESDLRGFEWFYLDHLCRSDLLTFRGHAGFVWSLAFSPDGNRIASAGEDRTVQVWDAATGRVLVNFREHTDALRCVRFNPDATLIASAGLDAKVRIWDPASGRVHRTLAGHAAYSEGPSGREPLAVWGVAFHPGGKQLASASSDQTVKLWDIDTGREIRTFREHGNRVHCVAYSPDGTRIASADSTGTILVWDPTTGTILQRLKGSNAGVLSLAFHPDGRQLAGAGANWTVKVWDCVTGQELRSLAGHTRGVYGVMFSADGKFLVSGSGDKTVKLWDLKDGRLVHTIKGHLNEVRGVAFQRGGKRVASASSDGTVKLWDPVVGQDPRSIESHTGAIRSLAFHPDGTILATSSADHSVRLWDPKTGQQLYTLEGHSKDIDCVAFSPDGKLLASAGRDGAVRLWDLATRREIRTMIDYPAAKKDQNDVLCVGFSPDGKWIAAAGADTTVRVWDASSGTLIQAFEGHQRSVFGVGFHPDGTTLASASLDRTVRLWDLKKRQLVDVLRGHEGAVWNVAFHPDGRTLASGGEDGTVRFWDLASRTQKFAIKGHNDHVYSVAFSSNGQRLVSAGEDRTVRIWDTISGQETLVLVGHSDRVRCAVFHPDGNLVASGGDDQSVKLWDATSRSQESTDLRPP